METFLEASGSGNVEALLAFVEANPDLRLDALGAYGKPALVLAACGGHTPCLRLLIDANAMVDVQDDTGNTALLAATQEGHIECVRVLIEARADLEVKNVRSE